jgi:hypothetical protein
MTKGVLLRNWKNLRDEHKSDSEICTSTVDHLSK